MKAIILAAGRGSRMKHLTETKPKGLVELDGKPLIEYQIQALNLANVSDIGIVTGYLAQAYDFLNKKTFYNKDWHQTNMLFSLGCASSWLLEDTCIISYSDIFYSFEDVLALLEVEGDIVITYDPNWRSLWTARFEDPLDDCETFQCDSSSFLTEIGGTPKEIDQIQGQYTGLLKISPKGWMEIFSVLEEQEKAVKDTFDMTTILQLIIQKGVKVKCSPMNKDWGEVDEETDLKLYEEWINFGKMTIN